MATRFSNTLVHTAATDAAIRGWAQFVEDTLVTTGGWVVTGDSGQTLPSALTAATGLNQKRGYRIYRMNDSLQATSPIFMKLDFGSGNDLTIAGMWPTIGSGSNGSGTITGTYWNGGAVTIPPISQAGSGASTGIVNSYGSAAPNRFSIAMFINSTSQQWPKVFCLERAKDIQGLDTGDGLLATYTGAAILNSVDISRYMITTGLAGAQPTAESGLNYTITWNFGTQTFGGNIGIGPVIHFKGVAQIPGINTLILTRDDVSPEGSFSTTIYGNIHTYQKLNALSVGRSKVGVAGTQDANARVAILYD
jgi:hypothetical protein